MRAAAKSWCRPLFRWSGSKRSILSQLISAVPAVYGRYVEPFAGSACLFFALRPQRAVLGDFNSELMQSYATIARHPRRVMRTVMQLRDTSETYYAVRALDATSLDDVSRAARFMYLNRHCFNGVYRTDKSNRFNVPRGSHLAAIPSEADAYRCSYALRAAQLVADDFEATLKHVRHGDFVYIDPPYSTSKRATYGEYGYGGFSRSDESRLLRTLTALTELGARVLFSYIPENHVLQALKNWSIVRVSVRRQVAGGASGTFTNEILAANYVNLRQI